MNKLFSKNNFFAPGLCFRDTEKVIFFLEDIFLGGQKNFPAISYNHFTNPENWNNIVLWSNKKQLGFYHKSYVCYELQCAMSLPQHFSGDGVT